MPSDFYQSMAVDEKKHTKEKRKRMSGAHEYERKIPTAYMMLKGFKNEKDPTGRVVQIRIHEKNGYPIWILKLNKRTEKGRRTNTDTQRNTQKYLEQTELESEKTRRGK